MLERIQRSATLLLYQFNIAQIKSSIAARNKNEISGLSRYFKGIKVEKKIKFLFQFLVHRMIRWDGMEENLNQLIQQNIEEIIVSKPLKLKEKLWMNFIPIAVNSAQI